MSRRYEKIKQSDYLSLSFPYAFLHLPHCVLNWDLLLSEVVPVPPSLSAQDSPAGRHIHGLSQLHYILQVPSVRRPAVVIGDCCCSLGILWKMSPKTGWRPLELTQSWRKWLPHILTELGEQPLCPGRDQGKTHSGR